MTLQDLQKKIKAIQEFLRNIEKTQSIDNVIKASVSLVSLRIEASMAYELSVRDLPDKKKAYKVEREVVSKRGRGDGLSCSDSEREGKLASFEMEWSYEVAESEMKAWRMYIDSIDMAINCLARIQRNLENERAFNRTT